MNPDNYKRLLVGIKGIGDATANAIVKQFPNIEVLLEAMRGDDKPDVVPIKVQDALLADLEAEFTEVELATDVEELDEPEPPVDGEDNAEAEELEVDGELDEPEEEVTGVDEFAELEIGADEPEVDETEEVDESTVDGEDEVELATDVEELDEPEVDEKKDELKFDVEADTSGIDNRIWIYNYTPTKLSIPYITKDGKDETCVLHGSSKVLVVPQIVNSPYYKDLRLNNSIGLSQLI